MKARKAALRLLVSAMLVVGLLPVAALAADGEQAGEVKVPAQAQVEESAQDQAQATADDQAQATADDQAAAPAEKAEATEPTTDQANPAVVAAADAADEPMTVANRMCKLYWYALIPGKTMDDGQNPNNTWFGLGVSRIFGVEDPANVELGTNITQYGNISETSIDPRKPLFPRLR